MSTTTLKERVSFRHCLNAPLLPVWRTLQVDKMSKLPGSAGVTLLGDKSLDFYRDPVSFYLLKLDKHGGRVFQSRLLNRPTVFICSVQATREMLCEKSHMFVKDPTDLMTSVYGETIVTTNGEEACLLRLSLSSLLTGRWLDSSRDYISSVCERCLKDLSLSGDPQCVYSGIKRLGTEMVLGLFLNVRAEEQPELFQEITQLCTQHWHGLISAPVKVPLWSSGFSTALDARDRLMAIIKDKLENDQQGLWLHCSPPSRWHWLGTIRKRHVREPEQTVVTCRPSCWRCRDSGLHSSGGGESLFRTPPWQGFMSLKVTLPSTSAMASTVTQRCFSSLTTSCRSAGVEVMQARSIFCVLLVVDPGTALDLNLPTLSLRKCACTS
ncbi:uncharacterized protein LOC103390318 isoform X4 [Cynoglossus semilaevis]|uniref:uncharacterized protein LOC103390318 isoform X4 n=1 Tax=Cynoglossus semilaevis TaxID=244447 RepID=UPI000D624ED5|nr:uncharacterized protein LOC103390318 isoform X4 [Cynoglossus semilaevis]